MDGVFGGGSLRQTEVVETVGRFPKRLRAANPAASAFRGEHGRGVELEARVVERRRQAIAVGLRCAVLPQHGLPPRGDDALHLVDERARAW